MEIFPQVVIAGASGLVGQSLHRHFLDNAVSCATLTRNTARPGNSEYFWDPYHFQFRDDMRRLSGIRAAILLSGDNLMEGRWTPAKKQRIRESRIRTTQAIVDLLSHLEQRPEVLLCASAVGFYGDRGDEILTEESAAGHGFLADVCRDWEAAADAALDLGIRVIHLRFGVVLAREGGALAKMLPLFRVGLGGNLGSGKQWMSWIALPTLIDIVEFCMNHHEVQGPVNVVANPVTNAEFTSALAHHLHRLALVPAPAFALRMAFGEMADAALLSSTRAIPAKLLQAGFVFKLPTLQDALQHLLPR
ncbi:MAG TPA: TIGR01777 family oxidoreductase [Acidobacteriaceae bacterium]|nr:TIGR01777 family oxidoreductase [Acidobacteriaceae bacterium]